MRRRTQTVYRKRTARRPVLPQWLAGGLWVLACAGALALAMRYDFTPGQVGPAQTEWPEETVLPRQPGAMTAVAFLHPRCVCTKATVTQLVRVLTTHQAAEVLVAVFTPFEPHDRQDWEAGPYVRTIRSAVPRAMVISDYDGLEARRFGALTSGTVLVYDARGREVFRGGITDRRGGDRDNPGLRTFVQTVQGWAAAAGQPAASFDSAQDASRDRGTAPVFGCPLTVDGPEPQEVL